VDWSASEIVCATAAEDGEQCRIASASRDFASVKKLIARVKARHPEANQVHAFIEAGSPGWVEMLHHAGAVVHVVDPRQAKAFATSLCSSGAKDDGRDSIVMTWMGRERCDRLEIWRPESALSKKLVNLSSLHETRTKQCMAESQRLRAYLRERFPELERQLDDLRRGWVARVLREIPTPYHAARLCREDFDQLMRGSGARKTTLEAVWKALEATESDWLTEDVAESDAFTIGLMVDEVQRLAEQLRTIERKLDHATEDLYQRTQMESVGGIGMKMANRLIELAFGGETLEDRDEASIKLGASPVFYGSGKTRDGRPKGIVKMRRSASPRARATTYLLGRLAVGSLNWAAARYKYDRARGKSASQSYRSIARSVLRILTAMMKNGDLYDNDRYVAALKNQGVVWAMDL
jgi:transposase